MLPCLKTDVITLHDINFWFQSRINDTYKRIVHDIISSNHRAHYVAILHILLLTLILIKKNLLFEKNVIINFVKSAAIVPVMSIIIRYG